MADIALLVVEEYERRRRDEERMEGSIGGRVSSYMSSVSRKMEGISTSVKKKAVQARAAEMEKWKKQLFPKSPLALAAFEGFFPA